MTLIDPPAAPRGDVACAQPLPPVTAATALFFDFDGTLVPLAPTPDAVAVPAVLRTRLLRLGRARPGRVALVSGRPIATLDALLGPVAEGLAVAGSHGAEFRLPGDALEAPARPPGLLAAAGELAMVAAANGLVFEDKPLGAALHYRLAPQAEPLALAAAAAAATRHGLVLQHGKMMVEVRAPGDKGAAVRRLAATPPMAGATPLFFGDDVTDEDGFAAAAALGGAGVLVGDPRPTAARYRLADPAALAAWIDRLLAEEGA